MKTYSILIFMAMGFPGHTQDMPYARHLVDTLTSTTFWGRGYTKNGMTKAADFIESEFKKAGLQSFHGKFQQSFFYSVNTFPGKMEVSVDGKQLTPGVDFIVGAESRGANAAGNLVKQDSARFVDVKNKIEVLLRDKLTWSVSNESAPFTRIEIDKKKINKAPSTISVKIENKLVPKFKAANVCGFVKGTQKPDSLLVITAHYDHLGGMGNATYFPGANDNASGVALLISLARHYSANPLRYSIAFIAFGGEEAGLRGSEFFVQSPLFPLKNIRFLTNLDLTGTGEEGITTVNASVFKQEFGLLFEINNQKNYFVKIKSRGKAANSDHYWFTERSVPSFFIYAMGGIQAYHNVFDRAETLPLTEFADLFHLIVDFNQAISHR
jgi:aminopeptidase YwaD